MDFISVSFWLDLCKSGVKIADVSTKTTTTTTKSKVTFQKNTRENKKVLQKVDTAEALTMPGVPNDAHQHMVTPRGGSSEGNSVGSIGESLEYEDIQVDLSWKTVLRWRWR